MLNTDIELAYDIDVDNTGKGTQCVIGNRLERNRFFFKKKKGNGPQQCKEAATKNLVATYARVGIRDVISYV